MAQRRATMTPKTDNDISTAQQTVYLSRGNVSGFNMKAMAMKLRLNCQKSADERKDREKQELLLLRSDEEAKSNEASVNCKKKCVAIMGMVWHPLNVLLLLWPLGIYAHIKEWSSLYIFWFNIIPMIPLAKMLGDATEELADALGNDTLSGLVNATLGNAVEMILTVQTLRKGYLDLVKSTLLGSILSNLLLVLGSSFLLGGFSQSNTASGKFHVIHQDQSEKDADSDSKSCISFDKEQLFTVKGALMNMSLHLLALMTIALPTLFASRGGHQGHSSLVVSRFGAIIVAMSYVSFIVFHLCTHKTMLANEEAALNDEEGEAQDDDDDKVESMGGSMAFFSMVVITVMISVSSELLVEALGEVVKATSMSSEFIGVILLPIAGNACEHASALRFAMYDRPGLSIGIAVGSSTQISLFVVPFAVIMGWCIGQPMDMDFGVMNFTILFMSTMVVLSVVLDGRSNWLKGFLLCNVYLFIGLLLWNGN
eukprot:TRINITY_DN6259_c1_g2_i1.p1 TRINITY_DN6259_c1_g2~~TRINITY_DN6259_c1_g2_i1.p1  ORF type:complete len:504 (+),score=87.28 TRINITY_DN6259_c1_g2_i1:66-1514(+)